MYIYLYKYIYIRVINIFFVCLVMLNMAFSIKQKNKKISTCYKELFNNIKIKKK